MDFTLKRPVRGDRKFLSSKPRFFKVNGGTINNYTKPQEQARAVLKNVHT